MCSPCSAAGYDPSTPAEIALADALDSLDLAAGRDFAGPAALARPTRVPPGEAKVPVLEMRARLGLGLFAPDDAKLGAAPAADDDPSRVRGPARGRRPSELARTRSYRDRDAARKRAARAAAKEADDAA